MTADQISEKLVLIGAGFGDGWMKRLKLAFINYQEECETGNLEVADNK